MFVIPDAFCCLEVDSYGHYSMKAKTNMVTRCVEPTWNEVLEYTGVG